VTGGCAGKLWRAGTPAPLLKWGRPPCLRFAKITRYTRDRAVSNRALPFRRHSDYALGMNALWSPPWKWSRRTA